MDKRLLVELNDLFDTYLLHKTEGAWHAAFARLGEILDIVGGPDVNPRIRNEWVAKVREVEIDDRKIKDALGFTPGSQKQMVRLMSFGDHLSYEEFIAVIVGRIDAALALSFLSSRGVDVSEFDFSAIDERLEELSVSRIGRREFHAARQQIERNFTTPMTREFLGRFQ